MSGASSGGRYDYDDDEKIIIKKKPPIKKKPQSPKAEADG
jgi:hypothetical protein